MSVGKVDVLLVKQKRFMVWNGDKTFAFFTIDKGLAYEVSKSASSNCFTSEGEPIPLAIQFCIDWGDDTCTSHEVSHHFKWPENVDHFVLQFDNRWKTPVPLWKSIQVHKGKNNE